MSRRIPALLPAFVAAAAATAPLHAQADLPPTWRIGAGFGWGEIELAEADGSRQDGDTANGWRVGFEGVGANGFGGGARHERSEHFSAEIYVDDTEYDVRLQQLFGHATYRVDTGRFRAPIRAGLLAGELDVAGEANSLPGELTGRTLGGMVEIEPELLLAHRRRTAWTLYGAVSLGGGATAVDGDGAFADADTTSRFLGAQLGTRLRLGPCELDLSYVRRQQRLGRDPGFPGYEAEFEGVLFGVNVVF